MPLTPEQVMNPPTPDGASVERIAHRQHPAPLIIVPYNPVWPQFFQLIKSCILAALGPDVVIDVMHAGSTSVPGLAAKNIVDVDLVVRDIEDESAYVPKLEALGFRFLLREPGWHHHRFFVHEGADHHHSLNYSNLVSKLKLDATADGTQQRDHLTDPLISPINLHVFPPSCPEVERHAIFREWLSRPENEADREKYVEVKREAARVSTEKGESMQEYSERKDRVVAEILGRCWRDRGWTS